MKLRRLLLGRTVMTNLDSIFKSRDITLPVKVHLVKAMVFPVVMYGCESWTIKKAEHQCFWIVVLKKTLESPLDCKEIQPVHPKGNQSWIFIGRTEVEIETPILWPPMQRTDSFEKTLMLGKIEDRRRRGQQRMRWLYGITDSMNMSLINSRSWWWTGKPGMLQSMESGRVGHDWVTELNWIRYSSGGFPGASGSKESACNVEDLGLIPRSGAIPGEGAGNRLW